MLQIANDNLEHYVKPTKVYSLTVKELESQVSNLIDEIDNSSDLSGYLKIFLKEELEKILNSIKNFDLYGSDPIRKSIYNIVANSEVTKKISNKAITGITLFLVSVATAIGFVNDAADLPNSIEDLKEKFFLLSSEKNGKSTVVLENVVSDTTELESEK